MEKSVNIIETENLIKNEKKEQFDLFFSLLREYNDKYNLTAITEEKEVFYKHFVDSGVGKDLFTPNAKVVEVGSGAGFPSIPLKILRPDLSFILVESVGKKCDFLQVVVDKLGLTNIQICNKRSEDLGKDEKYREKADFVVARAVARMNTLSEYCIPLLKVGGKFIAYKSGDTTEVDEAKNAFKTLGCVLDTVVPYSLPDGYGERNLVIVKKVKPTPNRYPRGQGKERKNPL